MSKQCMINEGADECAVIECTDRASLGCAKEYVQRECVQRDASQQREWRGGISAALSLP